MNIYEKLGIIQSKLKAPKGQYNSFGKYKYRSCEDILEAVKPLLAETKTVLSVTDRMEVVGDRIYVRAEAHLKDCDDAGEITTVAYAREEESKKGMDSSQVTGAASSYARKYALNGLFCIDDNKDSDSTNTGGNEKTSGKKVGSSKSNELIDSKSISGIEKIIKKYPDSKLLDQIKSRFKVDGIEHLTMEKGAKCLKMLIDYDIEHSKGGVTA